MKDLYHIFRAYNNTNFIIQQILKTFHRSCNDRLCARNRISRYYLYIPKNQPKIGFIKGKCWNKAGLALAKKEKKKKKPFFFTAKKQKKKKNPRNPCFGLHIRYVTINWQLRQFSCRPSLLLTSIFHLNNRPIIFLGVKEAWKLYVFILQNITIGDNTLCPNIWKFLTPLHCLRWNKFFHSMTRVKWSNMNQKPVD